MSGFAVKQEKFEGPLDMLLSLIERRQFHVSDIALAKVTDDFLEYIKAFPHFPIAESAQFAYIGSTLLLIKSKSLLPELALTPEEEANIEELEHRLTLLRRYRKLSAYVRKRFGTTPLFLPLLRQQTPVFAPPRGLSILLLAEALRAVIVSLPQPGVLPQAVIGNVITLEEMIVRLTERIKKALRMKFTEFARTRSAEGGEDRVTVIVSFLALLELVRQGTVTAAQEGAFGDIVMETEEVGTPRY